MLFFRVGERSASFAGDVEVVQVEVGLFVELVGDEIAAWWQTFGKKLIHCYVQAK